MKLASWSLTVVLLALPFAVGSTTIYKWTDERGTTVFSSKPPAAEAEVSNVQVVAEDDEPAAAPKSAAAPKPDNGNALQERISALEQQLQTLQTPPSSYAAPPNYYPPPDYYPPPSYPSDYPSPMYGYGFPYYPSVFPSYVVVAPGQFVGPVYGFGGFRFGVHPVPVTHAVGFMHGR